jgi:uncharacterized membrane protein YfcA
MPPTRRPRIALAAAAPWRYAPAMTPVEVMAVSFLLALAAGAFGALLGLGGGLIVVPALTLLLHIDIRYAIGASIVSVIATSSGAGAAYVKEGLANIRVGLFLEMATTLGALAGAFAAGLVSARVLMFVFALMLIATALAMGRTRDAGPAPTVRAGRLAERLRLSGSYWDPAEQRDVRYVVHRSGLGFAISLGAGLLSGLLGVGGGVIKVPTMNLAMRMPLKAAAATSNFMIGVTAAASAGVYFARGDIDPFIAVPTALGVVSGARVGARLLARVHSRWLRLAFTIVLLLVALEMIRKGIVA